MQLFFSKNDNAEQKKAIKVLLDITQPMAEPEVKKKLIEQYAHEFKESTWVILSKHKTPSQINYINARVIFANPQITAKLSEKNIIEIASFNRSLCEIVLQSEVVQKESFLKEKLMDVLKNLRDSEISQLRF
jgi:hypothetical protein